jgi:cysteine synthase A
MTIHPSLIEAIGNTPLIRLRRASEETGCTILGKAEFLNPGQSVKDRAALAIVRDAEERGELRPGGVIVEGTAGNTGIGLALVGAALGYRVVVVMPRTQSQEKKDAVIALGAELVEVDAVKAADENHYPKVARRIAEEKARSEPNGAVWANQFDNVANRQGHIDTTGPEIWRDTDGAIDGFICAVGSGGTLGGVSMALKARKAVVIGIADPAGAALYNWYKHGELRAEGSSITEGIGQGRITANLEGVAVDEAFRIEDKDWLPVLYRLIEEEGLSVGGSSALNVLGAMQLARKLGPGKTIVTILADYGNRYSSRLFNPAFLRSKDLPTPPWMT